MQILGDQNSIVLDMQFHPHSQLFEVLNNVIEVHSILDDSNNELRNMHNVLHEKEKVAKEMEALNKKLNE